MNQKLAELRAKVEEAEGEHEKTFRAPGYVWRDNSDPIFPPGVTALEHSARLRAEARLAVKSEESRIARDGLDAIQLKCADDGEGKNPCVPYDAELYASHLALKISQLIAEIWPERTQDEPKD